jgi:hypothetical protein
VSSERSDLSVLEVPALAPWPAEPEALARRCAAVATLSVDAYALRELHAGRAWKGPADGFFARVSRAPASDALATLTRPRLLGALVEAATVGERLGPAALSLVDEPRALDALKARYPSLSVVRVIASEGALRSPTREDAPELFALVDALAARGVRCEFED